MHRNLPRLTGALVASTHSPSRLLSAAGLCGGSASGKTTVANKIIEALDVPWVVLLSMDSFYKVQAPPASERAPQEGPGPCFELS